jgi:4-hydroxyproline epimerase
MRQTDTESSLHEITVIDSHTAGEPTRVVVEGGPPLGDGPLALRRQRFQQEFDHFRSAIVNEPHGSEAIVGALLTEPFDKSCVAGVIFFNNVGFLGMCGHGTIGVVTTLAHLGRIEAGKHRIDTPVGIVTATLHADGDVSVDNVPSFRAGHDVTINVPGAGQVKGDVAWGGNWFFLTPVHDRPLDLDHVSELTEYAWHVRQAVNAQGFPEVDHIELFGPPTRPGADARNFVLCPGKAYDRSPCGTGTSAKLACLFADGKLSAGQTWRQESIIGTVFEGSVEVNDGSVYPTIRGSAYVTAESTLILDPRDPLKEGIHG